MTDDPNKSVGTAVKPGQTYTIVVGKGGGGGGATTVKGANGQALTWNGTSNQWITVPVNTGAGGVCSTNIGQISLGFDPELAVPVEEKKEISDGCSCKKCKEYYQYAEPNQADGTLICYGCRTRW